MNALASTLVLVAVAAGTSLVTTALTAPTPETSHAAASEASELIALRDELAALRREVASEREARLSAVAALAQPAEAARLDLGALEAEVQRLFDERFGASLSERGGALQAEGAGEGQGARSKDELFAAILAAELGDDSSQALWDEAREAGMLDDLVALFEARAEERSNDPEAQVDVGHAYLQKIFEVGDGPAAGLWAGKADASFDRALALDERHWQARSSKAISLSFWPPIFGKQKDAISHFEVLRAQQEEGPLEDRYAQTYLLLGNLYHQTGQGAKAEETWRSGLELFPDDEELSGKLGGAGQ